MGSPARLRDSTKHHFAKLVTAQKGLPVASLVSALVFSAPIILTNETPDSLTTEHTATVLEEVRNDLAIFQEEYRNIKYLTTAIAHHNMSPASFEEQQRQRLEVINKFHDDVRPMLERILFDGNLSEKQVEELMREFSNTIQPPQQIAKHLHIRDFSRLREHRQLAMQNTKNETVEDVLTATASKNKSVDAARIVLPILLAAFLFIGLASDIPENRTLHRLAREKPKRPPRFKH